MANNVNIVINAQDKASQALGKVSKKTDDLTNKIRGMRMPLLAVTAAFGTLGAISIKNASALGESVNAINVVFKDSADAIHEFGKVASDEVGLSNNQFNKLATVTGSLLKDFGLSLGESAEQTIRLTKRASDLASVFDTDVSQAMNAINAAMRGETEAIRRYGVSFDDAALKTKAVSMGLAENTKEVTRSQKSLAALELIMQKTNDVQGDFGNTSDSLANSTRILKANLEDTSAELGQALLPIAEKVVGVLLKMVRGWNNLSGITKTFILVIGGLTAGLTATLLILPPLIAGVKALTVAVNMSKIAFVAHPVGAIVAILTTLAVIAIPLVIENWDKLSLAFKKGANKMAGFIEAIINKFTPVIHIINGVIMAWNAFNPDKQIDKINVKLPRFTTEMDYLVETTEKAVETQSTLYDTMSTGLDHSELALGKVTEKVMKLNEVTEETTDNSNRWLKTSINNVTKWGISMVGTFGENIIHFQDELTRGSDELISREKRRRKIDAENEKELLDEKLQMNKTYLDTYFDMYEENQMKVASVINKAHEEMESILEKSERLNKKAQQDESAIPGLSILPNTIGRTADHTSAVISAAKGGLRKASGEMMTSAEMREFLGIKMSDAGGIPMIGGTNTPAFEPQVNINVSPELDAQINFNRVADTLRQKQGDYTSGIGNL